MNEYLKLVYFLYRGMSVIRLMFGYKYMYFM